MLTNKHLALDEFCCYIYRNDEKNISYDQSNYNVNTESGVIDSSIFYCNEKNGNCVINSTNKFNSYIFVVTSSQLVCYTARGKAIKF